MRLKSILCPVLLWATCVCLAAMHSTVAVGQDAVEKAETKVVDAPAERSDLSEKLIGTWVLTKTVTPGSPSGVGTRLKMITPTHWCVVQPDPISGTIVFQHGGTYKLDGKKYAESIDFAGESTSSLIGQTMRFELIIEDDKLLQNDLQGVFNETWERAKPSQK